MRSIVERAAAVCLASVLLVAADATVELRGRVTNSFTEAEYRAVTILVTDRIGTEIGRAHPNRDGRYSLKITAPRYIIIKAVLEGYPTPLYQLDTQEYRESTEDREENKVFGDLRIQTYHQNITFGEKGRTAARAPSRLEDLLAGEDPEAVKAYQEARGQKEAGDLKAAIASLEKLIKKHPGFYLGHIDLGMFLAAQKENDRAVEIFTLAQKLQPDHPWAYLGLGIALADKRDYLQAVLQLEKAVGLDPGSIQAQFQLGLALFRLGEMESAERSLIRVVEMDPKFNPMAHKYLSSIYVKRQEPEKAARALESYLEHFPDAPDRGKVQQILKKLRP